MKSRLLRTPLSSLRKREEIEEHLRWSYFDGLRSPNPHQIKVREKRQSSLINNCHGWGFDILSFQIESRFAHNELQAFKLSPCEDVTLIANKLLISTNCVTAGRN
jgi:hypothetical protein